MRSGGSTDEWRVLPIAEEAAIVFESPDPEKVHLGLPAVVVMPNGRTIVAVDQLGAGVKKLPGKKGRDPHDNHWVQGKILTSSDHGQSWRGTTDFQFSRGRLFRDGGNVYLLGLRGSPHILKSADGGETWSKETALGPKEHGNRFLLEPANALFAGDHVYLVPMVTTDPDYRGDPGSVLAPVIMKARRGANLSSAKTWKWSQPAQPFRDMVDVDKLDHFGLPFFDVPAAGCGRDVGKGRWAYRPGWYLAHVLKIEDPAHEWFDPSGKTFHLVFAADTHRSGIAAVARATETADGSIEIGAQTTPSGRKLFFVPLPGGHMRFSLAYDSETRLYWLLGNQATDSMRRVSKLPKDRGGLPCESRRRLQLHFSHNLVDWCFAGLVACGETERDTYSDPDMSIHGNELAIVCRRGDDSTRTPYETNRIALLTVKGFRELAY